MTASPVWILFARPPVLGRGKTRLAAVTGEQTSLEVYKVLLENAVALLTRLEGIGELHSASARDSKLLHDYFSKESIFIQSSGDLGKRMADSIIKAARRHPQRPVILFGSDVPELSQSHLEKSAKILKDKDAVIGPTQDGGYYLIGFAKEVAGKQELIYNVFSGMSWSHDKVASLQRERFRANALSFGETPCLRDLDEASDLYFFARQRNSLFERFASDIRAVLPVYNESGNLPFVLEPLFASSFFREVVCADNDSTDGSREVAGSLGAEVTLCRERGYGATCLEALSKIRARGGCDIVVFLDGDGSDDPGDLPRLLAPILRGEADFVLGARVSHLAEAGSLLPHQRFGNWLAVSLIRLFFGHRFLDLGPFRAIRWEALERLDMDDRNFGWTIQMQLRALKAGLRIQEIPVSYRRRHSGKSKVTATLKGSLQAGRIILGSVFKEFLEYWKGR